MANDNNNRETGARHLPAKADADAHDDVSQSAAENRKPKGGVGLTESSRRRERKDPSLRWPEPNASKATPSPATEKVSGAGPAIAEHSKDAKAVKGGRQPGAYVKE